MQFFLILGLALNDLENVAYWEESEQSEVLANKFGFPQIQLEVWGESRRQKNFVILILGTVFPSLKLTRNFLFKYEHFFFLKTGNLIINWVPLSLLQIYCV